MRRAVAGIWDVPSEGFASALTVNGILFFLGGVAGCLLCANVGADGSEELLSYLESFLSLAQTGELERPALLSVLWEALRWPLLTVVLGFTALGVVGIPILFSVRGFLLSFAIASFFRALGAGGTLMAVAIFGISGLFSVPALFVLGVQGFAASRNLAGRALGEGRRSSPFGRAYFLRCGVCAGAFCVCVLLELLAVPAIVSGMALGFPA